MRTAQSRLAKLEQDRDERAIEALTAYLTRCEQVLTRPELADLQPYYLSLLNPPLIALSPQARAALAKLQADADAGRLLDRLAALYPVFAYWLTPLEATP